MTRKITYNLNKAPYIVFWKEDKGKIELQPNQLIKLFNKFGFRKIRYKVSDYKWVRIEKNIIDEVDLTDVIDFVKQYLTYFEEYEVINALFSSKSKLTKYLITFVETVYIDLHTDSKTAIYFYFKNGFVEVSKGEIKLQPYKELTAPIWSSQILDYDFEITSNTSDFETFCSNLAGNDEHRVKCFGTQLGYMLSRFKDPTITKAWILTDKNVSFASSANGGTGKSLIGQALSKIRNVATIEGKSISKRLKSWYLWQQVDRGTNIICIDDLEKGVHFSNFYSILTNGIDIEKRGKPLFRIDYAESPKILITSNHPVRGDIGNSDARRRLEFEVSDHYGAFHSPVDEFGKQFFLEWQSEDWNKFFNYMTKCCQSFLINGLMEVAPYNKGFKYIANKTGHEFVAFADEYLMPGKRFDKADLLQKLKFEYPKYKQITSHRLTKWIDLYSTYCEIPIVQKKSNGNYLVIVPDESVEQNAESKLLEVAA